MLNEVILIGRAGKDCFIDESKELAIAKFSIATSWGYGEKAVTSWHSIVCFGKTATIAKYINPGTVLSITGRINYREYKDKEGNKRTFTEIIANSIILISSKKENAEPAHETTPPPEPEPFAPPQDDLPF